MALGIDDAAVSFSSDDGIDCFHFGCHVHFSYGCRSVSAAMFLGDVSQGACRREVADGVSRCVCEYIVSHTDERIFLSEHGSVFANESESVHIRVNDDTEVVSSFPHFVHDSRQVFLQRLRIMREISRHIAVEHGTLNAQCIEKFWQDDGSDRVDSIKADSEFGFPDAFHINQLEIEHIFYVPFVEGVIL